MGALASSLIQQESVVGILVRREAANLSGAIVGSLVLYLLTRVVSINLRRTSNVVLISLLVALTVNGVRLLLQPVFGVRVREIDDRWLALEILTSVVFTILLLVVLILVSQRFRLVNAQVILRDEARRALEEDHESLRVRVFDHLHGTVQSELLVTRIRLLDIAREIDDERVADAIIKEASNISRIHDLEIRRLAHVMVASGIDVSLAEALRQLALACEGLCDVRIDLSEDFAEFDLTLEGDKRATVRLAIFRIIEECVNNALRHGQARAIGIRLSAQANSRTHVVTIKVTNDGLTPDGGLTEGAGLRVLRARASSFNGTVATSIESGLFTVESILVGQLVLEAFCSNCFNEFDKFAFKCSRIVWSIDVAIFNAVPCLSEHFGKLFHGCEKGSNFLDMMGYV
jgi:signal transduction histidine kinase